VRSEKSSTPPTVEAAGLAPVGGVSERYEAVNSTASHPVAPLGTTPARAEVWV
jgi:hypothetical protein